MAITAKLVKELRDITGAGMMDAKKALTEVEGNIEAAIDWLRTKGLAKAAKKSGRTAAEGWSTISTPIMRPNVCPMATSSCAARRRRRWSRSSRSRPSRRTKSNSDRPLARLSPGR